MSIEDNIFSIYDKLVAINPKIELVAATKTRSIAEIKLAIDTGKVASCGENKVQELLSKYNDNFTWDFIGQLQTNKVKYIIDKVRLIHSVDRFSLAKEIDKQANKINKVQDILIQVNSGKEESKGGVYLEDVDQLVDEINIFDNIKVRGIMAVMPKLDDEKELGQIFDQVYAKFDKLKTNQFCYLSMGMSNDYLLAVKAGANMVRLGRAIFGERDVF
ncbi:MAG: YggS family pyridoxal phosphate-dependent enzyme [Clostridia bacterium]